MHGLSEMHQSVLLEPDLPFPLLWSDRARDAFDLGNALLIVASDRLSASDGAMPEGIPDKGRILTRIASFWFNATKDIVPNHLVATDFRGFPEELQPFREVLEGRAILVRKVKAVAVECIVRGYLAGSAFREYQARGSVCGFTLPPGLKMAARLPEPMFTPSVKAGDGHHENLTMAQMMSLVGTQMTRKLKERSLALYMRGYHLAWERGIILADARFKFGLQENGRLILIDEVLTPDASRYWSVNLWKPGLNPPSLDGHCLLDQLETLRDWDRTPPAPPLSAPVIESIRNRYVDLALRFGVAS